MYVTSKSGRVIYIIYMERRAGLGGRLVVAGFTGPVKMPALGGVRRPVVVAVAIFSLNRVT